jgi:hypothetical protein
LSHTHGHEGEVDAKMALSGLAEVQTVQRRFCCLEHGVFWKEPIWHTVHRRHAEKPVSLA